MSKTTAWVILAAIIVLLAGGAYYLLLGGDGVNTNSSNTVTNVDSNSSINSVSNMNGGDTITEPAESAGWMTYIHTLPDYRFEYPDYLMQQSNYPNRLQDETGQSHTISYLKVSIADTAQLSSEGSALSYVNDVALEFPGTYSVVSNARETTHGTRTIVEKSYQYHDSPNAEGDYTMKDTLLFGVFLDGQGGVLIEIQGHNSSEFDSIVSQIANSLSF